MKMCTRSDVLGEQFQCTPNWSRTFSISVGSSASLAVSRTRDAAVLLSTTRNVRSLLATRAVVERDRRGIQGWRDSSVVGVAIMGNNSLTATATVPRRIQEHSAQLVILEQRLLPSVQSHGYRVSSLNVTEREL